MYYDVIEIVKGSNVSLFYFCADMKVFINV